MVHDLAIHLMTASDGTGEADLHTYIVCIHERDPPSEAIWASASAPFTTANFTPVILNRRRDGIDAESGKEAVSVRSSYTCLARADRKAF